MMELEASTKLVISESIGTADGLAIMQAVMAAAEADGGKPVAICVVDAHGTQLCAVTMQGTKVPSIKTAHDKATTAILQQCNTNKIARNWNNRDIDAARNVFSEFCPWGGGVLILSPHNGSILGAVGVSNRTEKEDKELASVRPSGWSQ